MWRYCVEGVVASVSADRRAFVKQSKNKEAIFTAWRLIWSHHDPSISQEIFTRPYNVTQLLIGVREGEAKIHVFIASALGGGD